MSDEAPPPSIRLHIKISDVGSRGAEVMILTEVEDLPPKTFGADSIEAAIDLLAIALKPMARRLLWGADQPRPAAAQPGEQ